MLQEVKVTIGVKAKLGVKVTGRVKEVGISIPRNKKH